MEQSHIDKNPLLKQTFDFSLKVIQYTETLESLKRYPMANQLFRSGTSIGANAMEAQNAESKADFVHKIKVAAKEAEETQYWLLLCDRSANYPDCTALLQQLDEIHRIIGSILKTAKKKHPLQFIWGSILFLLF
jgi:four helix bundle protein